MTVMLDKIKGLIEPIIEEEHAELVEIIYRREPGRHALRLLVDKEGGITLSDCIKLNEKISTALDAADLIAESYTLEVDSPGIDRPFKTKRDYERAQGRLVRITLKEAVMDKKEYIGRLAEILNDSIKIDVKVKGGIEIQFENIIRAREEIEI